MGFPSIKSSYAYICWLGPIRVVQALKVVILPLPLSAGVMCCPQLIFKPGLGRREKLPQKVGRRKKLAEKAGRREIYRPVPPPSYISHIEFKCSWEHAVPQRTFQQYFSAKFVGQADFLVFGAPATQAIFNPLV